MLLWQRPIIMSGGGVILAGVSIGVLQVLMAQ
jgi:hypothetical protein